MHTIRASNVNHALALGVQAFALMPQSREQGSRNGAVLEWPTPVATVYSRPWERVLFSPARDANPFFHFMEGLWLIAGRSDVRFVKHFNGNISAYSDDGINFHGGYGRRMRFALPHGVPGYIDQLQDAIQHLKKDPNSRRCVIQLWDVGLDAPMVEGGKDVPCNTIIFLKVRDHFSIRNGGTVSPRLEMRVCCRSNDMIWGAYGANAVHFSMLQEYIAGKLGVEVGPYTQISDSLHVYTTGKGGEVWDRLKAADRAGALAYDDLYDTDEVHADIPLNAAAEGWDKDLAYFFAEFDAVKDEYVARALHSPEIFHTEFFRKVVAPMFNVWQHYKCGSRVPMEDPSATDTYITGSDWRRACREWIERRHKGGAK